MSDANEVRSSFMPQIAEEKLAAFDEAMRLVRIEFTQAIMAHPPYHSAHEGISVMKEELEELWEHVRADTGGTKDAKGEAVQVASTAMRYIVEICAHG